MLNKVLYIGYQPLTQKVKDDFYFELVLKKGFEVEYWDLSAIYFPNVLPDNLVEEYIFKFNSFKELERHIASQENKKCLYVLHITYEYRVIKLFQILTQYNCLLSFFARGALPVCGDVSSTRVKINKALNPKLLLNFVKNIYAAYLKKIGSVKFYDVVFSAGELGYLTIGCGSAIEKNSSKMIDINSVDYDTFFDTPTLGKISEKKYCLFLDEYLPHHPDFILLRISTVPADVYYSALNDFFDSIEQKYDLEVVVAAHPKASEYKNKNPFNGRAIFFNETARLTKFCEFTIAHLSTSQSFSILNRKPIVSLTSNLIKEIMPQRDRFIRHTAEVIGSQLINLDLFSLQEKNISSVDIKKYEDYKYKYLTSERSENKKSCDIFISFLTQS